METVYRRYSFRLFVFRHWHICKQRWWMDINCDLEKNEHVTFFFLAHDCQPMCTVQEEKCPIYADTHVLFQLGLRFSIGNTLCNLKDSSQWFKQYFSNLFWQEHEIDPDVINPTFSFQSPGCFLEMPTFPNTVNSQWIKSVVLTYIFSCWMKKNIHIFPLICVKYVANVSLCSF